MIETETMKHGKLLPPVWSTTTGLHHSVAATTCSDSIDRLGQALILPDILTAETDTVLVASQGSERSLRRPAWCTASKSKAVHHSVPPKATAIYATVLTMAGGRCRAFVVRGETVVATSTLGDVRSAACTTTATATAAVGPPWALARWTTATTPSCRQRTSGETWIDGRQAFRAVEDADA